MAVVAVIAVLVVVATVLWSDVLELVSGAAFGAALDGAVARCGQPDDVVRVDWVAGAAEVLLVAVGLDYDWVVERAYLCQCTFIIASSLVGFGLWRSRGWNSSRLYTEAVVCVL